MVLQKGMVWFHENSCGYKQNYDIPHLAACLASKAEGIWAHDPHFLEQQKVKVFTNIDMLNLSRKIKRE